jgi:hypothetical protein
MTLEQFRASRVFWPDVRVHPNVSDFYAHETMPAPVYLYAHNLVIDTDAQQERFYCTIENESREGSLAELEEWLFAYGQGEGAF